MKYLSLFTGIGGFELGINQANESIRHAKGGKIRGSKTNTERAKRQGLLTTEGENTDAETGSISASITDNPNQRPLCIGYSEIDKYAIQTYQSHFPEHKNYGDITKIKEEDLPEFDLLVGGFPCQSFSIAGKRRGFQDTRGTLFFDIARIIKTKRPRLLLLENVKGLLSHNEGNTFRTIISTLDELGYDLQWQVLNSKNFGVPQNRERVFIVGHLRGTPRPEVFPFRNNSEETNELSGQHSNTLTARYYGGQANGTYITESELDAQKIRRLTPKECERLQGFPDNWTAGVSDSQRYKQCGNAVTVNVIQAIMERLLD